MVPGLSAYGPFPLRHDVARQDNPSKVYLGLGRFGFRAADAQKIGHPYQVRQRSRLHFPHDVSAMHLHCDLSDIHLRGNLFVQKSRCDEAHNLLLAGCQGVRLSSQ